MQGCTIAIHDMPCNGIFGPPLYLDSPVQNIMKYLDPLEIFYTPMKLMRKRLLITAFGELLGDLNKRAYMIITDLAI